MIRVRPATPTVACLDAYDAHYRAVFHNVRHFEQFTQLILGMLAETKRKSLPRLAKTVQRVIIRRCITFSPTPSGRSRNCAPLGCV